MNRKSAKILSALILAVFVLGTMPTLTFAGPTGPTIYMTPSANNFNSPPVGIGYSFLVEVWVDNVTDLCAYQVQVVTNPAVVRCFDAIEPVTNPNYVLYSILPYTATTEALGADKYTIGGSEQPGKPAAHFNGTGLITIFNITVMDVPGKNQTLSSALNINNTQTFLLNGVGGQITIVSKTDGSASITWQPPPKPYFQAGTKVLNPSPYFVNVTGTTFTIAVDIKNYYAGWKMSNATFILNYNPALINATGVVLNTADWGGPNSVTLAAGQVTVVVRGFVGTQDSGATVPVATITFKVLYQGKAPPYPVGGYDETALSFGVGTVIWDTSFTIHNPSVPGSVRIYALLSIPLPWFEVDPAFVLLGPDPDIGEIFEVKIRIKNLYKEWYVIAYQLRIGYDDTLLEAMEVNEGPFLKDPRWNKYGTLFASSLHEPPRPYAPQWNVVGGGFLMPNNVTGIWDQTEFPNTFNASDTTLFTVKFKAIKQIYPLTLTCKIGIYPGSYHSAEYLLDKNGAWVMVNEGAIVHGNYTITTSLPGRMIDVYTQYPAPYGGQGLNKPSDMFWPQKKVELYANVTYNWWPVQQKLVTFIVYDNNRMVWALLQDVTDEFGVAHVQFRLPWPCDNPEQYIGVWRIRADVDIACVVVYDWVEFHYDYLVADLKVTTDKYYYNHCEWINATVTFNSHAPQTYNIAIWITLFDELHYPVYTVEILMTVGGAQYCTAKPYVVWRLLHVEKFAAAGYATVLAVPRMYWEGEWVAAGPADTEGIFIEPF